MLLNKIGVFNLDQTRPVSSKKFGSNLLLARRQGVVYVMWSPALTC